MELKQLIQQKAKNGVQNAKKALAAFSALAVLASGISNSGCSSLPLISRDTKPKIASVETNGNALLTLSIRTDRNEEEKTVGVSQGEKSLIVFDTKSGQVQIGLKVRHTGIDESGRKFARVEVSVEGSNGSKTHETFTQGSIIFMSLGGVSAQVMVLEVK